MRIDGGVCHSLSNQDSQCPKKLHPLRDPLILLGPRRPGVGLDVKPDKEEQVGDEDVRPDDGGPKGGVAVDTPAPVREVLPDDERGDAVHDRDEIDAELDDLEGGEVLLPPSLTVSATPPTRT